MRLELAAAGWAAALAALVAAALVRGAAARRLALVARAAHELRRPLSAALLGLHGVVAEPGSRRRLAAVELELRRTGLALADLDAVPRGRLRAGTASSLDVADLLEEAIEASRPLAETIGAHVELDRPPRGLLFAGDRYRVGQALGNLVANALEHGAAPVRVRAHVTRTQVRIEVRDDGPGLPAPVATLAAGPHARRRGHGLAIAADVARRHGGRLLTAPVARGACLVLELPLLDATTAAAAADGRRPTSALARRALRWWRL
jgi:signal transduction histidine kinase